MKHWNLALALTAGLVLGFGMEAWLGARTSAQRREQVQALQAHLAAAQRAEAEAFSQRDAWEQESKRLQQQADEVHALRAEVVRLRGDLAKATTAPNRSGVEPSLSREPAGAAKKAEPGEGLIALENTPAAVRATLLHEMENAPVAGVYSRLREGQMVYALKGQLPDGRGIALQLGSDGSVLEKNLEIPWASVPALIQTALSQYLGDSTVSSAREVREGGSVRYDFLAKRPDATLEITVGGDGAVVGYSAKLRPPNVQGKQK